MPRKFSEAEEAGIRAGLLDAGRERFGTYGLSKTTVEDLTRDAGISKGAFYRFFESKEALFLALLDEYETAIHREIEATFSSSTETIPTLLKRVLKLYVRRVQQEPLLRELFSNDASRRLWRRAGEGARANSLQVDLEFIGSLIPRARVDTPVAAGMLRGLFFLIVHRNEIGADRFDEVVDHMVDAVVDHIVPEEDGDAGGN